jgi:hypothetical protein
MIYIFSEKTLLNLRKHGVISFTDDELKESKELIKPIVFEGNEYYVDMHATVYHSKERCEELSRRCWDVWNREFSKKGEE